MHCITAPTELESGQASKEQEAHTLKQWLKKVKELRSEIEGLRGLICNKYAEDLGDNMNCVTQWNKQLTICKEMTKVGTWRETAFWIAMMENFSSILWGFPSPYAEELIGSGEKIRNVKVESCTSKISMWKVTFNAHFTGYVD